MSKRRVRPILSFLFKKPIIEKCLLIFVIMVVSVTISIAYFENISSRQFTHYECAELHYEQKEVLADKLSTLIIPKFDGIISYLIKPENFSKQSGTVVYIIATSDHSEILLTEETSLESLINKDGFIALDVSGLELKKDQSYSLTLEFHLNAPMILNVGFDGQLSNLQLFPFRHFRLLGGMLLFFNITLFLLLLLLAIMNISLEEKFLTVALIVGTLAVFILPPYVAPDEFRHFTRAYQISNGELICSKFVEPGEFGKGYGALPYIDLPIELNQLKLLDQSNANTIWGETNYTVLVDAWKDATQMDWSGETVKSSVHGASNINPIAYVPQVLFISAAKIMRMPPLALYYMARLGNMLFSTLLAYIALKRLSKFKMLFFVLFFLPSCVYLRSTCSTDGLLMSLCLCLLSYILFLKTNKLHVFVKKRLMAFLLFTVVIVLIKPPYALLLLVAFIIPKENFMIEKRNEKDVYTRISKIISNKFFLITVIIILAFLLYFVSGRILSMNFPPTDGYTPHIQYMLKNPIKIGLLVLNTWIQNAFAYLFTCLSSFTSNLYFYSGIALLLLLLAGLNSDNNGLLTTKDKWVIILTAAFLGIVITATGYLMGAPNLGYIWGLQSRYYIPVVVAFCLALPMRNGRKTDSAVCWCITSSSLGLVWVFLMNQVSLWS